MATIDDKVVAMSFESGKFESGVNSVISALDKLKASLHLSGASKGLDDVNAASKKIDLSHIGRGAEEITSKLSALNVAAVAIFANIAMKAVAAGAQFAKSFTIQPIMAGYQEYATNLNSVQTILANTQASGATLKDVNAALLELNKYSDQTIYNFSQMAKNIGTFTAAGVDLKTSTAAIKGIANLAALSGSNADQASTAMYQLSQAISAGRVGLQDWNSVVNAGMGGTVFQRALAQTAEAMGTLKKGAVELVGPMKNVKISGESFRESIGGPGPKWLTSDVLTTTLKQFTGDLSNAELKAQGFNDAQIKSIQATAKTAKFAATEVKTLGQVFDVAKETAGSGWAQTFQLIFGDFGEAKTTFTAMSNAINGFINTNSNARNKILADWKELGGRTVLLSGIKTAFQNLGEILKPIKEAFRDIFPATSGKNLFDLTVKFKEFADALKPSKETVDNLKRTFAGLFAAFDIGKQIVEGILHMFGSLFKALGGGQGGFLKFTAGIGDFIVAIDKALKKGDGLNKFFEGLGTILAIPLKIIQSVARAIGNMFEGFSPKGVSVNIDPLTKPLEYLQKLVQKVVESFSGIGDKISEAFSNINFDAVLTVVRTGLLGALVLMIKKFLGKGTFADQLGGIGAGVFENINKAMGSLTGSMKAMQQNLQAKTLKEIAIAIALLAASVVALSLVDPVRMKGAIGGMAVMFGELIAAMKIIDKLSTTSGFIKLPFIAASLILLAGAIDLLVIAVVAMSRLSWSELTKGLTGVGVLLGTISLAVQPLSANSAGMIRASIAITGIAVALNILAIAVAKFGGMDLKTLGKGLGSVAVGLGILVAGVNLMPKGMVAQGVGLIAIAAALKIIADVVQQFGTMDWSTIGKGMAGIAGSLVAIAAAMHLMPKGTIVMGAGLILVSVALGKIGAAVEQMGGMSISQIAKGLGTLAGSLVILAAALHVMTGTLAGAAALAVAAAGIALLAPALTKMGSQSWGQILKGLVELAAALTILGIAGVALAPVTPALLGIGAAMLMIGGGLALAGAGIALVGIGLSAIAVAGPAAISILLKALTGLTEAIPTFAKNMVLGLLAMVQAFADTAPQFVAALVKIVDMLLDVVIKSTPKIVQAFQVLLDAALKLFYTNKDKLIQAGMDLIISLLQGIRNNIGQIVTVASQIIVNFLNALAANLSKIITAGANVIVSLLKGIGNNLGQVTTAALSIITKFLSAIANNLAKIATAGLSILTKLLTAIGSEVGKVIAAGTKLIVDLVTGIGKGATKVVDAGVDAVIAFIQGVGKNAVKLANAAAKVLLDFINGLTAAINLYAPQLQTAGMNLGFAIINGMTLGLAGKAVDVYNKAKEIGGKVKDYLGSAFGLFHSPPSGMIEMGNLIVQGLANGMSVNAPMAYAAATAMSNGVIGAFNTALQTASPSKVMMQIGQYVGQGFAQGLRGSQDDVRNAFTELNNKLTEAMGAARETIAKEEDKLRELRKAKKPDADAIAEAQKALNESEALLAISTAGHNALVGTLKSEKTELIGLIGEYEKVTEKLKNAQEALKEAVQQQADFRAGLKSQYSASPSLDTTDPAAIAKARADIETEQAKLNQVLGDGTSTPEAIASAQASLRAAQDALGALEAGKILTASGEAVDQLATYEQALTQQTSAVAQYGKTLEQLRKLGLDDTTYNKLLSEGPADQAFANQLLAGGRTAVQALNTLDADLATVSGTLATNAGNNLYQAGINSKLKLIKGLGQKKAELKNKIDDTAEDIVSGLVKGLSQRHSKLRKAIDDIADEMINELKKQLKIKSPSEAFAEIGKYSLLGLAQGFIGHKKIVIRAVSDTASDALTAMRQKLGNISSLISSELNSKPVIRPILDLTDIRSQSGELSRLMSVNPISAAHTTRQASAISAVAESNESSDYTNATPTHGTLIKFNQINNSPVALSEIEIYRHTRNQLSQLKSALAVT